MSFISAVESVFVEHEARIARRGRLLTFGVDFLDDAALGILPNDLVLVGARSGAGKTQLCCNIAAANIANGKRVHFMALEAERDEIEQRIKYQYLAQAFYQDPLRPPVKLSFQKWMIAGYGDQLDKYEAEASREVMKKLEGLFVYYKAGDFDLAEMTKQVVLCSDETDLIIIDHVHYFDFDDDNENRAMREIAKTARTLALEQSKPIILVAHLRKKDRNNTDLAPGLEEFHGSSDLYKIATKVITLAPGKMSKPGELTTFMRVAKNRFEGSVTMNVAEVIYLQKEGHYGKGYRLGDIRHNRGDEFTPLAGDLPDWAERAISSTGIDGPPVVRRTATPRFARDWEKAFEESERRGQRD